MKFWRVPLDSAEVRPGRGIVYIVEERCKGCGYCIVYCPTQVLKVSEAFNGKGYHYPEVVSDGCLNCHYCERLCPEFAIFSREEEAAEAAPSKRTGT